MNKVHEALKWGSPLHRRIVDAIRGRLRMSHQRMSDRHAQMKTNEELYQAYIPERDVDAVRRQNREIGGVPEYRTIEIPHTYAMVLTAHTYYTNVFLSRSPVLQLAGRHGESEQSRLGLESLLAYQVQVGMMLVNFFVWLLDPGKYGYGVLGHYWESEVQRVREWVKAPATFLGLPVPGTEKLREQVRDIPGYEGSKAFNVRPQDWFPDPRVALIHFQRGEFCSRFTEIPWNEIFEGQKDKENPRFFNYTRLKAIRENADSQHSGGLPSRDLGSERVTTLPNEPQLTEEAGYNVPIGYIKGHEFFLKLVPNQWGLGSEDRQEIWVFNISMNGVIFGAQPLGELHNKFPFDILTDEIDGYTIFPRSTVERSKPLNDVLTWLVNSHFYNVRQTLNNQFVLDPSMLVMKDVENPAPGKHIRLKPHAYGKDVRTMITQLSTVDITRNHIASDMRVILEFFQRMLGTNDTMMGMIEQGGRKTATEVRGATNFGINRLKTTTEWHSAVGWSPMTQKLVQRTQQHYKQEKMFRLVGDQASFAPSFGLVTPDSIVGFYDFEAVDGTMPVDRFAQANLWQMILGQMGNFPSIMATYDIAKIFAWVAHLAGIKNMQQFRLVSDQAAQQQLQAGNVVPISQAASAAGVNLNEPRQIAGVGPTG